LAVIRGSKLVRRSKLNSLIYFYPYLFQIKK